MATLSPTTALDRAVRRLIEMRGLERHADEQDRPADHWEGEDVWNPMLAAQYAIAMHVMERPLSAERRRLLVQQLRAEQLPGVDGKGGGWGLHPHGGESLFVTTLVYVAARMLGVSADDPMLAFARQLFAKEDVRAIASWGKAWLSIANLYGWEGVNAVPPEAWLMPTSSPLHPANYYCHTRLIYMGMASVYGLKLRARRTPLVDELRQELYAFHAKDGVVDFESLDFASAKSLLREKDLWAPPSAYLSAMYRAVNVYELAQKKLRLGGLRRRCLASIRERMRWELRSSDYTCLSPVNGLLFALTLHAWDRNDPDVEKQMARFEGWLWEDEKDGTRVAGARSATWDSAFALQALSGARPALRPETRELCDEAIVTGLRWLRTQQIETPAIDDAAAYRTQYRLDPTGGFCFAGVWHGWPVSDCTAEALCAFLEAPEDLHAVDPKVVEAGVRFLLQCQNPDGGFGSYESRKQRFTLEWMNPAEMFGDSMTELSYVECTASNLVALCQVRERFPTMLRAEVDRAVARAERRLRDTQKTDGSWPGAWGVHFVYGTMFGVRGLLAAGASKTDPAVRKACEFVLAHQRPDGSWGEHWKACLGDTYEDLGHGHVTQTAWAMLTLLEAHEPNEDAIARGASWLASMQLPNGDFPIQEFAGVFFRTALIEYRLYRRFFPVWALALAERRLAAIAHVARTDATTPRDAVPGPRGAPQAVDRSEAQ
ncbi:MAG: 2,3-oxidosqualene cyclase [Sandaracinus sp.]|nr:2,3-oxidosqualene cyclase [Sandaracinus sp.]